MRALRVASQLANQRLRQVGREHRSLSASQTPSFHSADFNWLGDFEILKDEVPSKKSFDRRLKDFEHWLRANGAQFEALELRDESKRGHGCAAFARSDIEIGLPVVEVPFRCLINSADNSSAMAMIARDSGVAANEGNLFLALRLLELWTQQLEATTTQAADEKRAELSYGPYLDILPRRLPHVPLFWGKEDLGHLQGSPTLDAVATRRALISRDLSQLQAAARRSLERSKRLGEGAESDHVAMAARTLLRAKPADFAVAEMTVCSRAFRVKGAGRGGRAAHCMVPLADLLNSALPHTCDVDFGARIDRQDREESAFVMTALRHVSSGKQGGGHSFHRFYFTRAPHPFLKATPVPPPLTLRSL